jgi:hypothetical protein
MKAYATALRIVYRRSQKMIQIDQDGQQHDEPGALPACREAAPRYHAGDNDMQQAVNDWSYRRWSPHAGVPA